MSADLLKGLYEAFGRGDIGAVLGAMDPSMIWRPAEGSPYVSEEGAWVGPNAILENVFMRLGTEWEGFRVTPATFSDAGERVIVEGRYTGTYKATGNAIDAQFCHIWDVKNGKITAFQQYVDTGQMQAAIRE
jgi:ketosteroid isomerase-like protein